MVLCIVVLDYDTRLVEVELAITGWEERLDDLLRDCGHATRHGFDHFAFNESEQEPTILSSCSKPVWELKEAPVYRFETPAKIRPQHVPRCDCIAVECELALLASQVMHQELGRGLRSGTHVPQHSERTYELDIECVRPDWEALEERSVRRHHIIVFVQFVGSRPPAHTIAPSLRCKSKSGLSYVAADLAAISSGPLGCGSTA
jgi:hypothetical protein